jgi:hypothetical protein
MRVPIRAHLLALVLFLLAPAAAPGRLRAQAPLAPGTWSLFEWFLGPGPAEGSGFLLDAAQRTRLRVTDDGITGDAFDVYVNGALAAATPSLPGGVLTGAFDGDAAWGTPGLSRAELFLAPGQYLITLVVREVGSGVAFGEGFVRADAAPPPGPTPTPTPGVVPEPSSVASLAGGLGALALAARRRARRAPRPTA